VVAKAQDGVAIWTKAIKNLGRLPQYCHLDRFVDENCHEAMEGVSNMQ